VVVSYCFIFYISYTALHTHEKYLAIIQKSNTIVWLRQVSKTVGTDLLGGSTMKQEAA
jgi:hypothetical protein